MNGVIRGGSDCIAVVLFGILFFYLGFAGGWLFRIFCVGWILYVVCWLFVTTNTRLENIQSVALDDSSRTSVTLVKVIFREFLEREPEWTTRAPNLAEMLEKNDAALIIGDPGMAFPRQGLNVWDMASLWNEYTGLGFVFAMWMVRDEAIARARRVDFAGARDEGVAHIQEIVHSYQDKIPMSVDELRNYLTENIVFKVDESMERGLRLYFELAFKHGLIERVKPLSFI